MMENNDYIDYVNATAVQYPVPLSGFPLTTLPGASSGGSTWLPAVPLTPATDTPSGGSTWLPTVPLTPASETPSGGSTWLPAIPLESTANTAPGSSDWLHIYPVTSSNSNRHPMWYFYWYGQPFLIYYRPNVGWVISHYNIY